MGWVQLCRWACPYPKIGGFNHRAAAARHGRRRWDTRWSGSGGHWVHPDPSTLEIRRPRGIRVREMSPQQPAVLSPASRFQPKTAPLPLPPPHGPSFGVPKGAHVQANALAEVSQIRKGAESGLEGKYPGKAAASTSGKARLPQKGWEPNAAHAACPCSLQQQHWGTSPEE